MGSIGMPELIVIFIVILMLFGSKRLPELARGLGKGIHEFKKATNDLKSELDVQPIKQQFDQGIKGSLDEIRNDIEKSVQPDKKQELRNEKKGEGKREKEK